MSKLQVYSAKGIKKPVVSLPKNMQANINMPLLSQALRVYEDRQHPGLSKVKTRSEVSLSTRKVWRQKGTGRARHGARSAPIFVGGGIAHGPKGVKRKLSLPKKMRQKALAVALTHKASEGKVILVDNFSDLKKTKEAVQLLTSIREKEKEIGKNSRFTVCLSPENIQAKLAFRNIKEVEIILFDQLNAHNVYFSAVLLIDSQAIKPKKVDKSNKK